MDHHPLPTRPLAGVTIALVVLIVLLALAAPALAADGVRVIPAGLDWPQGSQIRADVSADIVVFQDLTQLTADLPMWADAKYLGNDSLPIHLDPSLGDATFQWMPKVFVDDGEGDGRVDADDTIYVVWTRSTLAPENDDIEIWKGHYDPAADTWTPVATYPKTLVSGTAAVGAAASSSQRDPAIGAVGSGADRRIIVAWEDTRDNGYDAPLIYVLNLSAVNVDDPDWESVSAADAGFPVDFTPIAARGQWNPTVGPAGVFWMDERWSFWDDGNLKDTAIWRAHLSGDSMPSGVFSYDIDHAYDNGLWGGDDGLCATYNGAAWLHSGPYGADNQLPYAKAVGGSGAVLTALDNSFGLDAEYGFSTARTVYALDAPHGALGSDGDVFFYDSYTHTRVPVCNRSGAEPPFVYTSTMGAVGPAAGLARVVWSDARNNTNPDNDEADLRLYEAFVPGVSLKISARSIRLRSHVHLTASVAPNFAGATVYFQLVKVGKRFGAPVYTTSKLLNARMTLGSRSTASRTWTPPARGTYHLRAWFAGGTKYSPNGTVPVGKERLVPHVPNGSKVLTLVVR